MELTQTTADLIGLIAGAGLIAFTTLLFSVLLVRVVRYALAGWSL